MDASLIFFDEDKTQASALASCLNIKALPIQLHRFPDGESLVRLPPSLSSHVLVFRTLDHPNDKLIELILACAGARKAGVQRISLICPYLSYMRQDCENHPGEVISQQVIGELLCRYIDDIITVDPHLHRIQHLEQAYPLQHALSLSAAETIGAFIRGNFSNSLLVGPDEESQQWVSIAAEIADCEFIVANKTRLGDRQVEITLPEHDYKGRSVILVDDMISTGGTLINIAQQLKSRDASVAACIVTHCLCSEEDEKKILCAGIPQIISCDSIAHNSNRITLASLLADAVRKL